MFGLCKEKEEKAIELHRKTVVVDAHCDRIMAIMPEDSRPSLEKLEVEPKKSFGEHLDELEAGGIKCQIFALWNPDYFTSIYHQTALMRALQMVNVFFSELEKQSERITLCTNFSDITKAIEEGKLSAVLSIEGGEPLMGDVRMLRIFYMLGVRALGLTWYPRNKLADGSWELRSNSGLSTFGAEVVEEMNKLGMIVDVSHINERGFWDVIDISKSSIIASHSNCRALCDHHRNLTDDQIRAVADKEGAMGITYVSAFLDKRYEKATVERVLDHIDHAVELAGTDHVGLGSDYSGLRSGRKGLEDITQVPNITKGLVSRGYSDCEIEKIMGGSFLRIFKNVLIR